MITFLMFFNYFSYHSRKITGFVFFFFWNRNLDITPFRESQVRCSYRKPRPTQELVENLEVVNQTDADDDEEDVAEVPRHRRGRRERVLRHAPREPEEAVELPVVDLAEVLDVGYRVGHQRRVVGRPSFYRWPNLV